MRSTSKVKVLLVYSLLESKKTLEEADNLRYPCSARKEIANLINDRILYTTDSTKEDTSLISHSLLLWDHPA